jgi:glucan 1,3-beta-glucosidase
MEIDAAGDVMQPRLKVRLYIFLLGKTRCAHVANRPTLTYFRSNYSISKPIIQYYFTVFIGHPSMRPVVKGRPNFKGIALIDTDVYDDKTGDSYWVNQNK